MSFTTIRGRGRIMRLPILDPDDPRAAEWARERYANRRCVIWYEDDVGFEGNIVAGGLARPPHDHPVEPAPRAAFTYTPAQPVAGEPITFDASPSTPAELIDHYEWQLPIGADPREGKVIVQTFDAGRPIAYLQIFTVDGRSHIAAAQVDVTEP